MLVLDEGQGEADAPRKWDAPAVALNVAVDLRYDDGEEAFFVIEPDAALRKLDEESWEPDHQLVGILLGAVTGARFVGPTGRAGAITKLRHKYVARLHYVLNQYELRFPTIAGFRRVPVEVERPDGLDALIAELKARADWVEQEQARYRDGPWPLGMLGHRLGLDVIDTAAALASRNILLKVAIGNKPERDEAARAIQSNHQKGCVLDLLAFWTAYRLRALDAIIATCGPISLPQSVMDRLRARREQVDDAAKSGGRSASYEGGKIAIFEVAPDLFATWRDEIERAIAWATANAAICPLVAGEGLPVALREHLRTGQSDIFDSIVLAMGEELLLVTDDLSTREFCRLVGGGGGTWLHAIFLAALNRHHIDLDTYIRWSADMINSGHNYIGTAAPALIQALRMDAKLGEAPGYLFKSLSKMIGGRNAEVASHIGVVVACLSYLWSDDATSAYRKPATGLLLRQLIRERVNDYGTILRTLVGEVQNRTQLVHYIGDWTVGHFIFRAL